MGHFWRRKSVLVTSHTKKALSVVKEKVPKSLQDLCVTVLEDNNQDMERSVDGITEYISAHSALELFEKSEKIKRKRLGILDQLSDVRKKYLRLNIENTRQSFSEEKVIRWPKPLHSFQIMQRIVPIYPEKSHSINRCL